jgi:uncharacterized membrane protein YuzA (DUF378 family)
VQAGLCVAVVDGGSAPTVLGACNVVLMGFRREDVVKNVQHSVAAHLAFPF